MGRAGFLRRRSSLSHWWAVGVGLVLTSGIVLRFVAPRDLWLDEAQSVAIARLPVPQMLDALRQDGSPPLYYLLLHGWLQLVGDGPVAVRALSGLCGVLTLPVVWATARHCAGSRTALLLVLLVAGSPFAVRYATEARMYALVMLLVALGGAALEAVQRRPGPGPVVALAVVTGALLLTHAWALHLVAVVGVLAVAGLRRHRPMATRVLGGLVGGVLLFAPWVPSLLLQLRHTGTPWAPAGGARVFLVAMQAWQGGTSVLAQVVGVGLLAAAVRGCWRAAGWVRSAAAVVLGGLAVAAAVSVLTGSAVSGRYTSVVVLVFLVLAAAGLAASPRSLRLGGTALLAVGGLVLGALWTVAPRTQAGEVAAALGSAAPGDLVVFCPDQLGPAVSRLAPGDLRLVTYPTLAPADRVDWTDYAERMDRADPADVAARVLQGAGDHAVWVVTGVDYRVPSDVQCQAVVTALAAERGTPELLVQPREGVYEQDRLQRFAPPT